MKNCDLCGKPGLEGQGFYGCPGDGGKSGALPGSCRHYACHVNKYGRPEDVKLSALTIMRHSAGQLRQLDKFLTPQVKTPPAGNKGSNYNRSDNAAREFKVLARYPAKGRTSVSIECPFCLTRFQAYVWSLSGGGKKCPGCGAMHASFGVAYPLVGNEDM